MAAEIAISFHAKSQSANDSRAKSPYKRASTNRLPDYSLRPRHLVTCSCKCGTRKQLPLLLFLGDVGVKVAALTTAATIVWSMFAWHFWPIMESSRYYSNLPLKTIYQNCVADGFHPKWVCEDKHEFAATFFARQGQGLLLADLPVGTKMEGLTYRGGLSRYTTTMLARVNGLPVMIFVDRVKADTHPALPSSDSKLHLFRKELDRSYCMN